MTCLSIRPEYFVNAGAQKRCSVICFISVGPPWIIPTKSSRYNLTWARAVARACGERDSQLLLASSVATDSSAEVCSGLVSAKSLRWCDGAVWCVERVSSVRYLTVLVVAQKKAAGSTYPMGIEK